MIKTFFRLAAAVITSAVILSGGLCSYAANSAQGFDEDNVKYCGIYDEKDIFSEEDEAELTELIQETSRETEMYLYIYISDTFRYEESAEIFAGNEYERIFGEDTDGALYYMDLAEGPYAYDYISTHGKGILMYDKNIDSMFDVIYNYLPSTGEPIYSVSIYTAVEKICEQFKKYGEDDPGFFNYSYDEYTGKYIYFRSGATVVSSSKPISAMGKPLLISLCVGLAAALLFYFISKSHYKFKKSCSPNVYVSHEDTRFTRREDVFIRQYTTKTKIESSSGGGGRSGGGGGRSGGGSRGGGGRRR